MRKKPATGGRATGYSYSIVLKDNDPPDLIVPMSWSGRSVLLCTNRGVASSLLIPPGDFISPEANSGRRTIAPIGSEFDPSRLKANRDKIPEATNDTIYIPYCTAALQP
jgi:hypothetical protein